MKWSDRWEIRTTLADGTVRRTELTALLVKLGASREKPQAETWAVQAILSAVKQGFNTQKVEAYFDGYLLLSA